MNVIEKNMRGTEFFSKGHPVLNRLACGRERRKSSLECARGRDDYEEEQLCLDRRIE